MFSETKSLLLSWPLAGLITDLSYSLVIVFVRSVKWVELQILKLFPELVKAGVRGQLERIGVVVHLPGDPEEWSPEEEQRVLKKCRSNNNYKSVVHFKSSCSSFFIRLANQGFLALGEMYVSGELESATSSPEDLTIFVNRAMECNMPSQSPLFAWNRFLLYLETSLFNLQTRERAFQIGDTHYDLGNDLHGAMLGPWMQYSCAYFAKTEDHDEAQLHKLELIAKKLDLFRPGLRVLDMGCGWGTLCKYLAEVHGASCVGITVSKEGAKWAREICAALSQVEIRVGDYRELGAIGGEKFDRIVSIEMMEHVGFRNHREFMTVAHKCLKDDGLFLLQTCGATHKSTMPRTDLFVHLHTHPNSTLTYQTELTEAIDNLFVIEDWHNFGPDFARTMDAWRANLTTVWPRRLAAAGKHDARTYRLFVTYLSVFKGAFLSRKSHLWQIVLSKDGLKRDYRAAR